MVELREKRFLLLARIGDGGLLSWDSEQSDVDPGVVIWLGVSQPGADVGAVVRPLRAVTPIAQDPGHEVIEDIRDLLKAETWLSRTEGEAVTRHRWRHHCEGILLIAPESRRIGKERYDLVKIVNRTRPAMGQQQWHRVPPDALFMDEMEIDVSQWHGKLSKPVEGFFVRSPIVIISPMSDQGFQVAKIDAVVPAAAMYFIWPADVIQPAMQVIQNFSGYVDCEWFWKRHRIFADCRQPTTPSLRQRKSWLTDDQYSSNIFNDGF